MRALLLSIVLSLPCAAGDWPQWRGPLRNGVQPSSPKLLGAIPEGGLRELWESEPIPANNDGGLASPIAADGKVFVSLIWHRREPTETRQIGSEALEKLGHHSTKGLSPELLATIEETRRTIPASLRGKKLDEFIDAWIAEHFDEKTKEQFGGFVRERFKKGALALPLDVLAALGQQRATIFTTDAEMGQWLDAQGWPEPTKQQIIAAVPVTKKVADDAVVALDLETGKTLWKRLSPGAPVGQEAAATPAFADGKVYAAGSSRVWCLDAATGVVVWETAFKKKRSISSSLLHSDGLVILNTDGVTAYDAATGEERWQQKKAGGGNSSPVSWNGLVLINGSKELQALDLRSGAIVWSAPGGGDATPAIVGETLVVQTANKELGLAAYRLSAAAATKLWNFPFEARRNQSSALVHDGAVYLMDDEFHSCFDLANGSQRWREPAPSNISSPVLADGKLFTMANNGNTLLVLKPSADARMEIGKANVRAQWVPSPCIAGDRLVLRLADKLKCWSLAP